MLCCGGNAVNAPIPIRSAIVTGGTGPIGIKLIELLVSRGIRVDAVLNPASSRNNRILESPLVRRISCGLEGLASWEPVDAHDALFHLGWIASENRAERNDADKQAVNIGYTLDAARLAVKAGCVVFVGAGSQAEYGFLPDGVARVDSPTNPVEAYGVAKFAAGRLSASVCGQAGIRHCWGRILSVYGEYDRPTTFIMYVINALLRGDAPRCSPCEQAWDYLYTGDCANALYHMALSGRDGVAYPLGSGTQRPLKEYVEEVRAIVNPRLEVLYGALPYPEGQVMRMAADTRALMENTAYRPAVTFADGIRGVLRWLSSYCRLLHDD